ncbi:MAG: single-stranded DNA-binding protein, partial [Clostridiales bacterium]
WRQLAETCGRYLSKGKIAAVDGRLQIRTYEAKDGSKRTASEVVAENVRFLSPKDGSSNSESGYSPDAPEVEMSPLDDDVPF